VQKNERVANGFGELLSSLGIKYAVRKKIPYCNGKKCSAVFQFDFFVDKTRSCFNLRRKHDRLKDHLSPRMLNKSITGIEKIESVPAKCISVDNKDHLYVAGKTNTVTHNSMFISALLLYFLMADNEAAAQIWCLATVKTQAAIVYDNAKAFVSGSDDLRKYVRTKRDKSNDEMLLYPETQSFMKAGGKNSENQDGLNPHVFAIDELHAVKNRNTYDVFSSAQGARTQPMAIIISTFGSVREGIFDAILERCHKVLNGKTHERLFPMIFRIDDTDDPNDESCWIKANPGLGSHPTKSYIKGEYDKAINDPAQWPSFLTKHLNRA